MLKNQIQFAGCIVHLILSKYVAIAARLVRESTANLRDLLVLIDYLQKLRSLVRKNNVKFD